MVVVVVVCGQVFSWSTTSLQGVPHEGMFDVYDFSFELMDLLEL